MKHSSRPRQSSGFTLIELMIAVAVLGILGMVALPTYRDYVTRGKITEAFNTLTSYSLSLSQYYQDNRTYLNACTSNPPTSSNFTYSCALNATTYTLTATGSTNATNGFVYTITDAGARATVSTGWQSYNNSCWISSRSGSCQ